jgi:hypothetical protein
MAVPTTSLSLVQKINLSQAPSDRSAVFYVSKFNGLSNTGTKKYKNITFIAQPIYIQDKFAYLSIGELGKTEIKETIRILPSKEYGVKIQRIDQKYDQTVIQNLLLQVTKMDTVLQLTSEFILPPRFALCLQVFSSLNNVAYGTSEDTVSSLTVATSDDWDRCKLAIASNLPDLFKAINPTVNATVTQLPAQEETSVENPDQPDYRTTENETTAIPVAATVA